MVVSGTRFATRVFFHSRRDAGRRALRLLGLLTTGLAAGSAVLPAGAEPGRLSGDFSITSGGGAAYQVSIAVPPGVQRLTPQLSLTYSSQGGNGQLGVGWSLGGFAFIQRCGQTIAQDGRTTGVNYSATDRFCLNGQRLVNTDAGAPEYYSDGATYHTEVESWMNVTGHNEGGVTCGEGPCYFTATASNGARLEFGLATDARNPAKGAPGSTIFTSGSKAGSVRVWALSRYTDRNGNSLVFHYTDAPVDASGAPVEGAGGKGAYYPSRIDYTANDGEGSAAQRSVDAPVRVHSMTVAGAHNYYITGSGLLVHNCPFRPKANPDELSGEAEIGEMAAETGDVASIAGEAGTDAAAIGEATDVVEGAAAVAGGAEVVSDIAEGLVALCLALCWL
ncbi:SpvB/TcaC N-terminal domain-containing protein [uncultured Roseibium sp.]|uniref:SpvB/TcaC N-terminal domain-containing protein n=1 Tax=uncultured Roseibium sp. TaxID=1936171 RepID=UPI003217E3EE